MKPIDHIGLKQCKLQADFFEQSVKKTNCSSGIFIRRFMLSELAERIDKSGIMSESKTIDDMFTEIENQYGPSNYGKTKYNPEELHWIGYLYRYWAYTEEKSSKCLYRIIKPEELRNLYIPYHSLDPAKAIDRIKESKSIAETDDIQRGVEIMRMIHDRNSEKGYIIMH